MRKRVSILFFETFLFVFAALILFCAINIPASAKGEIAFSSVEDFNDDSGISFVRFRDDGGDNMLVLQESDTRSEWTKDESGNDLNIKSKRIYAHLLLLNKDGSMKRVWRITDFEAKCEFDITAHFIHRGLRVTDLNGNGIAEVWIPYITGCASDASTVTMKIIMYEGGQKYAIRGNTRIYDGRNVYGGDYVMDAALKNGDKAFRDYGKNLWEKMQKIWRHYTP